MPQAFDFLATPGKRRFLFAALYLSEGAPIGFVWWALPTLLRAGGVAIDSITWLTAILVLPWTFKWLWAPLIDVLRTDRWTFRHWIITLQILMGVALLPLYWLDLHADYSLVATCLFLHAMLAATQDAAIDGLSIAVVPEAERGRLNGWMQAGMLLGRSAMGGGTLVLVDWLGSQAVVFVLIAVIWFSLLLLLGSREPARTAVAGSSADIRGLVAVLRSMRGILTDRRTWLGLLFAGTAGAAFEGVGAVAGPYLIDEGMLPADIGWFFALPVVGYTCCGALLGGYLADRTGRRTAVVFGQLLILTAILGMVLGDPTVTHWVPVTWLAPLPVRIVLLSLMYLGIGMFTAATYAMFMDMATGELRATQFSAYMGATNGCESWSGLAVGRLIRHGGYAAGFTTLACVSLLSLLILPWLHTGRSQTPIQQPSEDR